MNLKDIEMIKRLLLVFAGSVAMLFFLIVTGLAREIFYWIYGGFLHDKIAHFVVGFTYTILLSWSMQPRIVRLFKLEIPLGAILMLGIATFDEVMQIPRRGRDANPFDLLASVIGIAFGVLLWVIWQRYQMKKVAVHA